MEVIHMFLLDNWKEALIGFMILEKVVKLSPGPWDDILLSGLKFTLTAIKNKKSE